jgi:tRNA threonylcarbamoyladenosine biosynthesis protein TsaE
MQSIRNRTDRTLVIEDEKALAELAASIGQLLKTGDVVTLSGPLGAGKTAFARALIKNFLPSAEVPSPTFTLVQTYDLPRFPLWHFDLYRLEKKEMDILELGWDDARRFGIVLVEWPDRLGGLLPKNRLEINIGFCKDSENKRDVVLVPCGAWLTRLEGTGL